MKYSIKLLALIFITFCISPVHAEKLSVESVNRVIASIDKAAKSKDANTVLSFIAENAGIIMHTMQDGRQQTLELNKQQYSQLLSVGWQMAEQYDYKRNSSNITIQGNVATVKSSITESMAVNGHTMQSQNKQTTTIELINGSPLITKIVVYAGF